MWVDVEDGRNNSRRAPPRVFQAEPIPEQGFGFEKPAEGKSGRMAFLKKAHGVALSINDKKRIVRQLEESIAAGYSMAEFCEEKGVSRSALWLWRKAWGKSDGLQGS